MTAKTIINKLGTLILIAMILGIVVGLVLGETAQFSHQLAIYSCN